MAEYIDKEAFDEERWERGKASWESYLFDQYYNDGCNGDCRHCDVEDCDEKRGENA